MSGRNVVLTGMRTTGPLHLGHLAGALERWKEVQDSGEYECFFLLADLQALTTHADRPEILADSIRQVTLDWLSVGLDPALKHVHFVQQSMVRGRADLSLMLSMVATYAEVMRDPTLKSELESQSDATVGFVSYPVDQVADIHCVDPRTKGARLLVPVGEDQLPHLELAREVVRRANRRYGTKLTPCEGLVGRVGRLVGTDGEAKMSKSRGNTINLTDDDATIRQAIRRMSIDPARSGEGGRYRPGNPAKTIAFSYLDAFCHDTQSLNELKARYRDGTVGDGEVKEYLYEVLLNYLHPIRLRRAEIEPKMIRDAIMAGTEVASQRCQAVVEEMRQGMFLTYPQ